MASTVAIIFFMNWLHRKLLPNSVIYLSDKKLSIFSRVFPSIFSWAMAVIAAIVAALIAAYLQGYLEIKP